MSEIAIETDSNDLQVEDLVAFYVGWPEPPPPDERLQIVRAADEVAIARDRDGAVVGFATAITDGRFAAYIPLVEVLPHRQGEGIGTRLVASLLERLGSCYMIDVVCDDDAVPFYERLGAIRLNGMAWRNPGQLDQPVE